jgi:hypothetical protein
MIDRDLLEHARTFVSRSATDDDVLTEALRQFVARNIKAAARKSRKSGMPANTRYVGESYEAHDIEARYLEHMARQRAKQNDRA